MMNCRDGVCIEALFGPLDADPVYARGIAKAPGIAEAKIPA